MGKKVMIDNQPSKSHKKQFNNLIKLLKPKVYITHSSNFKNLVQQLTGNNIVGSSPSSSSPSPPDHHHHHHDQELSVDSSEGSIPSSINVNTLHQPCFSLFDSNNDNNSMGSQEMIDVVSQEYYYYRNIESWLLDLDSYSTTTSYEEFVPLDVHQEVSIDDYGYDLSSLF